MSGKPLPPRGPLSAALVGGLMATGVLSSACVASKATATQTTLTRPEAKPDVASEEGVVHLAPASSAYVDVEVVGSASGESVVVAPARVDFRDGAVSAVGAPLSGRIVHVHVQIGDRVRKGDALITLDCPDAAAMRSAIPAAEAALREARSALERQTRMMREGVGIERDRIAAETRVSELEADHSRVVASAQFIGTGTGTSVTLYAPLSGTVISRKASVGLAVQQGGEPLLEIGDQSSVWLVADVFERDLKLVREGARVQLALESVDTPLEGRVMSVGTIVATGLRTAPVRIGVQAKGQALKPGMFGQAKIDGASASLTLPTEAVLIRDGKESVVYVRHNDSTYVRRSIVVGQHADNGRVEIVSGLNPGEEVVVKGALLLDGAADQLL